MGGRDSQQGPRPKQLEACFPVLQHSWSSADIFGLFSPERLGSVTLRRRSPGDLRKGWEEGRARQSWVGGAGSQRSLEGAGRHRGPASL